MLNKLVVSAGVLGVVLIALFLVLNYEPEEEKLTIWPKIEKVEKIVEEPQTKRKVLATILENQKALEERQTLLSDRQTLMGILFNNNAFQIGNNFAAKLLIKPPPF